MGTSNLPDRDELEIQMQKRIAELAKANKELRAENMALNCDITKFKKANEVLSQSEQRVRLKLENEFSSSQNMNSLELSEIIDVQAIKPLMDDFYKLTHIPIGLNDLKGNVLAGLGWQDICTKFHRVHPDTCEHCVESNIKLSLGVTPGEFKLYKCKNNMWDVVTPIMVSGQQVGYIFAGQFFFEDEPLDYELFRSQARKYGFNEEEYIAALEKVPKLSREAVSTGMAFFMTFANMLSQLSYSNIKLAHSMEERDTLVEALQDSERRERARSDELEAVLDAVPVAVFITHDPQVRQLTGNRLSYEWLGVPVGTNFSKSAPEGEKPKFFKLFKDGGEIPPEKMPSQMAAAGKEVNDCELDIVSADGKIRHVLGNARPLHDEQGNLRGSVSAFIDITERNRAEEALKKEHDNLEKLVEERTSELQTAYNSLKKSERSLAEAQEIAHIGNWERDFASNEFHWSDEMYHIFGLKPQESKVNYGTFLNYVHPDDRDYINNTVKEALKGKPLDINFRIIRANGEERIVHVKVEAVLDEKNNPIRTRGVTQDITERKIAEENLRLSEERYRSFVQNFRGIAFQIDKNFKLEFIHGATKEITGYNEEELFLYTSWRQLVVPEDIDMFLEAEQKATLSSGDYHAEIEYRIRTKDGKIKWMNEFHQKISGKDGSPEKYIGVIYDITEKKEIEKALDKIYIACQKEIHHRIKNNLQVISSLLDLQADKFRNRESIKDLEVLEAFRESQDRVSSIALIHEELYEGEETDSLNLSLYIERLAENLLQTYRLGNSDITLNSDIKKDVFFNMDIAVPLGMIVNELITNSLKYAFPDRRAGELQIKLFSEVARNNLDNKGEFSEKDTRYTLIVSDNGIGIPNEVNLENTGTSWTAACNYSGRAVRW